MATLPAVKASPVRPRAETTITLSQEAYDEALKVAFRQGVACAAEIADGFNAVCSHPYRLGDVVLSKLHQLPKKKVRRNLRALPSR